MSKDIRRALQIARELGSPERKQAFEQWGGSPERWYHGTSKDVDFSKFKIGRHGAWFTRDPASASSYAEQNDSQGYKRDGWNVVKTNTHSRVIPVHLKLGKTHTGPLPDHVKTDNYKKAQSDWFDQLRAQGYDSWVPEGQNVAVILKNPANIKSAIGNRGTFDPNDADIGKAHGGATGHPLTQDVYHGTQAVFDRFKDNMSDREHVPSLMLGTHVARDPAISSNEYFTNRTGDQGGHVMPLKTYPDDKFYKITQIGPAGERIEDDEAVERAIKLHAYRKHPDMLALALMNGHGTTLEEAIDGAQKLAAGEPWKTPTGREFKNLNELVHTRFAAEFPSPAARTMAVKSFRDHLIKQGYAGVKYENTAPDETREAKDHVNYIVFNKPTREGYYPLRGRFAAFNPEDKASPDLMKAEGGAVDQEITSADTSIKQIPALFKSNVFEKRPGQRNLDIGGGKFDLGTQHLAEHHGVESHVYDPFNRSEEHNASVLRKFARKKADSVTAANVLNVIQHPHHRKAVIQQAHDNLHPNGKAYFGIYEGNGSGKGAVTSKGWQNNRKAEGYMDEVREVFPHVERRGNIIVARKRFPRAYGGATKEARSALMIAHKHQALLRRVANIYKGPRGGRDFAPGGGGYAGPGGGQYIGPSNYAKGGKIGDNGGPPLDEIPPMKLYSGAAKLIAARGQAKGTPQQYAALPGIKPDELKHSKFDELGTKARSREEVIKHLEDNRIPLKETTLGGDVQRGYRAALAKDRDYYEEKFIDLYGRPPRSDHELLNEMDQFVEPGELPGMAAYDQEGLKLPGGKNYREVLLHLPKVSDPKLEAAIKERDEAERQIDVHRKEWEWSNKFYGPSHKNTVAAERAMHAAAGKHMDLDELVDRLTEEGPKDFTKSHWHDTPNVLAHIRMHDRKGPNGEKVLHVEEIQSDWGQKARKEGFKGPRLTPEQHRELSRLEDTSEMHSPEEAKRHGELRDMLDSHLYGHPQGPYVDNTQKWTDLALKRVLHEAAHGGYDKVVFTPGDEQNERGNLSHHVSELHYDPDVHELVFKAKGEEGPSAISGLTPERLADYTGKEVAERLLATPRQKSQYWSNPVHSLIGQELEIGGKGMRKYYDEILPKRLQALAQQHDPKAKVQLKSYRLPPKKKLQGYDTEPGDVLEHMGVSPFDWSVRWPAMSDDEKAQAHAAYENSGPALHSLDITPQMRDSIKQNGFSQFKRGGAVDENEGPIADWHWRPLDEVKDELQLHEIPSHVHKFGEFMDETARRATLHGLTPRDLIKAYVITRSSVGRRALDASTIRRPKSYPKYGFDELPADLGKVRPEGAMGHWLHTKMGQRYLDAAENGRIDEEAVKHAIKSMGAFGLPENAEGKGLRWAAKNLPGREGRISELIARGYRGQSTPGEWRDEVNMPGIKAAKSGFLASMLGRGDAPTFDARQIILHTGLSTDDAAKRMSRKGQPEAAVSRLINRQNAMDVRHDPSMSPFYQHLLHHAVWDKTSGEETTHQDVIDAMRGAKNGGRQGFKKGGAPDDVGLIGSHPVVRALMEGLPHEAFVPKGDIREMLGNANAVRPYDDSPENVKKALEIAQRVHAMKVGTGSGKDPSRYYGGIQPVAARDVKAKVTSLRGRTPKDINPMTWEDLHKIGKGGSFINLSGDRTRIGTLGEINGKKLNWPVHLHGGPDYIREGKPGTVWANAPGIATGVQGMIEKLSRKGPVYGIYSPMGALSGDQAHHMFDAVMAQIDPKSIDKQHRKAFDEAMRSGAFIMGNTEDVKKDRARVAEKMKGWPGIDNPKEASNFALKSLAGVDRKAIIQYLDKKMWTERGFPSISMTRAAITDPKVRDVHDNTIGGNVALLDPKGAGVTDSKHPTYTAGIRGEYVGTLPFVQRHYAAPTSTRHLLTTPTKGKGMLSHPFALNDKARSSYRKLYEQNIIPEPIDQRMVDSASEGQEKQKLYGLKTGGSVVDRALALTKKVTRG